MTSDNSDHAVLDLLRRSDGGMRIVDLANSMEVTATAIRQRLGRLMAAGFVQRSSASVAGRGRPSHRYQLTETGHRQTGSNFMDLAIALWQEVRRIEDADVRRGLLQRLSQRLAGVYGAQIKGNSIEERMHSISTFLGKRDIPFEVVTQPASVTSAAKTESSDSPQLPVLKALGCPYNELAEQDRSICSMERMLFSELVGQRLTLSQCRLDGEPCCTFEVSPVSTPTGSTAN